MRLPKEIIVLLVLLAGVMAYVLWYVADRKAKMRAEQNAPRTTTAAPASIPASGAAPAPASTPALIAVTPTPETVPLNGPNAQKTIDFSSGQAVVKDTPEDRAAMATALEDMTAATGSMTFGPRKKTAAPTPAPTESVTPAQQPTPPKP